MAKQDQSEFPKGDHSMVKFETPNGTVRATGGQMADSSIDKASRADAKSPSGYVPWGYPNSRSRE